jgi:septal ring factor EnvC (AmiA/AmiB activator)
MAEISIKEAINAGWASRATIYREIKAGALSVKKTVDGRSLVDTAELIRVFGEPRLRDNKDETNQRDTRQSLETTENAVLKERLEGLERDRMRLEREIAEAKEREAWLKQQLERQTNLLGQVAAQPSGGFWRRLIGK